MRIIVVIAVFIACACQPVLKTTESTANFRTEWQVTPAAGMDALLLIGTAAGDVMQAEIYGDEIGDIRSRVPADGLDAIDTLGLEVREKKGLLLGPSLAYFFSAGSVETLDDVIASAADPVARLKPGLMQSPHWSEEEFDGAMQMMPVVYRALTALHEAGFNDWYDERFRAEVELAVERNLEAVSGYDVIPEQERLLGRELDPGIEIIIVNFSKPYGIRVTGQRFIAWHGWDGGIQLRVAAHELFHPPFAPDDPELRELLGELENDAWLQSIVENHDPKFGYNSFMGVVNEGSTQALDQVVSERLGFARDPGERWRTQDEGMHMLAAALYDAMKESGFADRGGNFATWFKASLRNGALTPDKVREHAARVVGRPAVDRWFDLIGSPRAAPLP